MSRTAVIFILTAVVAGAQQLPKRSDNPLFSNEFVEVYRTQTSEPPNKIRDCPYDKFMVRVLVTASESGVANEPPDVSAYFFEPGLHGCNDIPGRTNYEIMLSSWPGRFLFKRDAVKLDPVHNKVLLENNRVRVIRLHFGPGESGPIVDKRPRVIISLTDSHAVVTFPDGHSEPRDAVAGSVAFGKPGSQATKNVGDTPFENIAIELKSSPRL